jgi:hypothetical protein
VSNPAVESCRAPPANISGRAPLEESRKWGIYFIVNLLFKTYFKLNSASVSRTILTSLAAYDQRNDIPPLEAFPKSQRVTFRYYEGVLFFLEENYLQACLTRLRKLHPANRSAG